MLLEKGSDFGTAPSQHHRTNGRLNSRVPVAIDWTAGDQQFRTDDCTVDVSSSGCRAFVTQEFAVGHRFRLINLVNQDSCEVVPAWRRSEGRHNWELGLELQEPGLDFWGLDF